MSRHWSAGVIAIGLIAIGLIAFGPAERDHAWRSAPIVAGDVSCDYFGSSFSGKGPQPFLSFGRQFMVGMFFDHVAVEIPRVAAGLFFGRFGLGGVDE